jgi:ketosteroid isomerase-like protein
MSEDALKTVVRRFFEAGWNACDAKAVSDIVHDDYESNDGHFFRTTPDVPGGLERLAGTRALAGHIGQYKELYDGLRFTIERMTVDGDTVTTVWSPAGTTRDRTFTTRSGRESPYSLRGNGVSRTQVLDGKVVRHDLYWARDPLFP